MLPAVASGRASASLERDWLGLALLVIWATGFIAITSMRASSRGVGSARSSMRASRWISPVWRFQPTSWCDRCRACSNPE